MGSQLQGYRLLVVEDEYVLAFQLASMAEAEGATVIGPVARVADALEAIETLEIDGAVLDLNLHGTRSYAVADRLLERNIPFLIASGYDASDLPERYRHVASTAKPVSIDCILAALAGPRQVMSNVAFSTTC